MQAQSGVGPTPLAEGAKRSENARRRRQPKGSAAEFAAREKPAGPRGPEQIGRRLSAGRFGKRIAGESTTGRICESPARKSDNLQGRPDPIVVASLTTEPIVPLTHRRRAGDARKPRAQRIAGLRAGNAIPRVQMLSPRRTGERACNAPSSVSVCCFRTACCHVRWDRIHRSPVGRWTSATSSANTRSRSARSRPKSRSRSRSRSGSSSPASALKNTNPSASHLRALPWHGPTISTCRKCRRNTLV